MHSETGDRRGVGKTTNLLMCRVSTIVCARSRANLYKLCECSGACMRDVCACERM